MTNLRKPLKGARQTSATKTRASRESTDRNLTQDREVTDADRLDMLKRSLFQASLPDLPKIDGHHVCWLTTGNPRDPVHGRIRLGYSLLTPAEIPEFATLGQKSGDYAGCIMVNEMIAAKLPIHLYEAFMRECHFDQPLQQEEAIYNEAMSANEQAAQAARRGGRMKGPIIEAGVEEMGNMDREPPTFSDNE
jgi:hypothetical protein